MRPRMVLLLAALLALWPARAGAEEEVRTSEATQTLAEAWAEPGFRLRLRFGYEELAGVDGGAADGAGFVVGIEPGARVTSWLSLSLGVRYAVTLGDVAGVRHSTTADATLHPLDKLFFTAGLGYAGLLLGGTPSSTCYGEGMVALARLGWLEPLGELVAMGPVLQADVQATSCALVAGGPRFGTWSHAGWSLAWSFAWR